MRFTHILVVFVALVVATACSYNDIDEVHSKPEHASQYLQVVGRVAQYSDCNVATRSKKEGDESKVTSMGLALFPIENGTIGNCLYYDFELGGSIVFIVNRHDNVFENYVDKEFAMFIFANMQDAEGFPTIGESNRETESGSGKIDGVGKSLEYFTTCAAAANEKVKDVPANGFPMVGSLGNTLTIDGIEPDGKTLILKPAQIGANVDGLPLVNDSPTDNLEIPLKSMYAKFTFTISVDSDQEIVGNKAPRFDLLSYEVHNIAATVDSNSSTNDDNDVLDTPGGESMANYAQGATVATFDFYLPERYLSTETAIDDVLPAELKNASTEEIEKYRQRYKNKLVDGKAATYVTITGKYTDHQGHVYDVDYNIYLGGNNYNDFNIIRNTHYDNSITIRGISASDNQAVGTGVISIDWRVDVTRSTPLVIGLRRESLLDAHFEVRPLRLRLVGDDISNFSNLATVKVLNENGTDTDIPTWIRIEKSGTDENKYITDGLSAGKRKYFTTDLVTNTLATTGKSVTLDINKSNQAVWIYVDENTTTLSRAAIVRVSYDGVDNDYKFVQHGLYKVTVAEKDYYIERFEEYLYNFDAEDSYGQIKEEGMPWGLDGVQLSKEHLSFKINESNTQWNNYINNKPSHLLYDFYTLKQDKALMIDAGFTVPENEDACHKEYAGHHFTEIIYNATKDNADTDKKVNVLTMADSPKGAVEYCYNRNKRDANGNVVKVEWYLPSADELEDFIVPAYSTFKEFQDNYYWTSQPAYTRNAFYYQYQERSGLFGTKTTDTYGFVVYEDNTRYARATKVNSLGNDRFEAAKSGLNDEPNEKGTFNSKVYDSGTPTDTLGYFKTWYQWKRERNGNIDTTPQTTDQWYWNMKDETATNELYYAFVNENYFNPNYNYGMLQEGYHERTKSNRVRCVRVAPPNE